MLLLLVLLLPTAHAGFPWPGGSSSQKGDSPAETQAAHAARFEAVTGGGLKERTLPKGVCLREMHATALSSYAYPANNPIEDRHVLLDEQQGVVGVGVGGGNPQGGEGEEKVPGMLHAAVFDGHGTYF